jgi:hypothetical protein
MVNYRDPAKVARDLCTCPLPSGLSLSALIRVFSVFSQGLL